MRVFICLVPAQFEGLKLAFVQARSYMAGLRNPFFTIRRHMYLCRHMYHSLLSLPFLLHAEAALPFLSTMSRGCYCTRVHLLCCSSPKTKNTLCMYACSFFVI